MRMIEADKVTPLIRLLLMNNKYAEAIVRDVKEIIDRNTIEAEPVVRCKDCRNYKRNQYSQEEDKLCMCWCDWIPTEPDDFCSYGEREEGADNG